MYNSGASRRGNAESYHNVIASAAKQSSFLPSFFAQRKLDCFVARAPRNDDFGCLKIETLSIVVPANAGTHNHREWGCAKLLNSVLQNKRHGVWVPAWLLR